VAGIIDGLLDGDLETGVERGAAMAAVALTTRGDAISLTRGELETLVGAQNGDVDR
jgi:sugar/nucleoside kinase (ribokinase family)